MSEDYALVRYKDIPAGFVSAQSSDLIVNAVKDMVLNTDPIGHYWEWLDRLNTGPNQPLTDLYSSKLPVSGSIHQYFVAISSISKVTFVCFNSDADINNIADLQSLSSFDQFINEFDLRGTSKLYDFNNFELDSLDGEFDYDNSPPISLDSNKQHRIWLAEYCENNTNPCAIGNACALTILVEEITDEETNDARFILGAHMGSIITSVNANERLIRLIGTVAGSIDPPYLYALSTDAALAGVPKNPNRIVPSTEVMKPDEPNWLGQNIAINGSWIQLGSARESLAAIGYGSHLPDSYMLSTNGRSKLLPLTTYAKQDKLEEKPFETKWTQVSTSVNGYHTLALDEFGRAWAWGKNFYGQLGIGLSGFGDDSIFDDSIDRKIPVLVGIPTGHPGTWIQISAGGKHSLGIDINGKAWAWGDNFYGQLGTNNDNAPIPVDTNNGRPQTWRQLSAGGFHSLGIASDNTAWAWGYNDSGQLGIGTDVGEEDAFVPIAVDTNNGRPQTWMQLSAGGEHSLGIASDNTAWAWGFNNKGQLGINNINNRNVPTPVNKDNHRPQTWKQLSAGGEHSLGIASDNTAWAWGGNFLGQLGIGTEGDEEDAFVPIAVDINNGRPQTWMQLSAGNQHSLGISLLPNPGKGWAWGDNTNGQTGLNTLVGTANIPTNISGSIDTWSQLSAGNQHSLGISLYPDPGKGWSWGRNNLGQLGDDTLDDKTIPSPAGSPNPYFLLFHKSLSTELGRTRYVRQFGTEPLEHGIILVSSTPSSQQAWKALGNGSNQVILWSLIAVQVP